MPYERFKNKEKDIKTFYSLRKLEVPTAEEREAVARMFPCNVFWRVSACENAVLYVGYSVLGSTTSFLVVEKMEKKAITTEDFSLARSQYNAWRQSYVARNKVRNRARNNIKPLSKDGRLQDFMYCLKHECNDQYVIDEVERVIDLYVSGLSDYNYISNTEIVAKGFGSVTNLANVSGLRYTQVMNCVQRKKISAVLMPVLYPLLHETPHLLDEEVR